MRTAATKFKKLAGALAPVAMATMVVVSEFAGGIFVVGASLALKEFYSSAKDVRERRLSQAESNLTPIVRERRNELLEVIKSAHAIDSEGQERHALGETDFLVGANGYYRNNQTKALTPASNKEAFRMLLDHEGGGMAQWEMAAKSAAGAHFSAGGAGEEAALKDLSTLADNFRGLIDKVQTKYDLRWIWGKLSTQIELNRRNLSADDSLTANQIELEKAKTVINSVTSEAQDVLDQQDELLETLSQDDVDVQELREIAREEAVDTPPIKGFDEEDSIKHAIVTALIPNVDAKSIVAAYGPLDLANAAGQDVGAATSAGDTQDAEEEEEP